MELSFTMMVSSLWTGMVMTLGEAVGQEERLVAPSVVQQSEPVDQMADREGTTADNEDSVNDDQLHISVHAVAGPPLAMVDGTGFWWRVALAELPPNV